MNSDISSDHAELYSNAIVAFAVIQGLGFVYAFGSEPFFNCVVKTAAYLACSLLSGFGVVMLLSVIAVWRLHLRNIEKVADRKFAGHVHIAKQAIIVIFHLLPISVVFLYGIHGEKAPVTSCYEVAGVDSSNSSVKNS
jgi:hypothetical protein